MTEILIERSANIVVRLKMIFDRLSFDKNKTVTNQIKQQSSNWATLNPEFSVPHKEHR